MRELLGERVTVHVYPGGDHVLMRIGAPPSSLAPGFHADLLAWLDEQGLRRSE